MNAKHEKVLEFECALASVLKFSYFNKYDDNLDPWYFEAGTGKVFHISFAQNIKNRISQFLSNVKAFFYSQKYIDKKIRHAKDWVSPYDFRFLYNKLSIKKDRELLLKILAYRALGSNKVKLTDISRYIKKIEHAKNNFDFSDWIYVSDHDDYKLYKGNFLPYANIALYSTPKNLVDAEIDEQYSYKEVGFLLNEGDYVIDAGAYSADTALSFADKIGKTGKVFAFEFLESNIGLCNKNLSLNPHLANLVEIVPFPLSEFSGKMLVFSDDSSCSKVLENNNNGIQYKTVSIDDYVKLNKIIKIDFIKMDIEGSELAALKGAKETIRKFKPKLAISVYHKKEDMETIPKFVLSLNKDYNLYLKHVGVVDSEVVLFCM